MLSLTKDTREILGQLPEPDSEGKEGVSILQQELSDTNGFPSCYLYKDFWIELNQSRDKRNPQQDSKKLFWEVLIHPCSQSKTVISIGSYPTRLEAALKAEQIICKWEKVS